MENSDLSTEVTFEEKFAGQIYMLENMIEDAERHISKPGYDLFWINCSMKRCKNALKLLQEHEIFNPFRNDKKMTELVNLFQATIKKLESVK